MLLTWGVSALLCVAAVVAVSAAPASALTDLSPLLLLERDEFPELTEALLRLPQPELQRIVDLYDEPFSASDVDAETDTDTDQGFGSFSFLQTEDSEDSEKHMTMADFERQESALLRHLAELKAMEKASARSAAKPSSATKPSTQSSMTTSIDPDTDATTQHVRDAIAKATRELDRIQRRYAAARDAETVAGQRRVLQSEVQEEAATLAQDVRTASIVASDSTDRAKEYINYQTRALSFAAKAYFAFHSQTQVAGWELEEWMRKVHNAAEQFKQASQNELNGARDLANKERLTTQELHRVAGAVKRLNTHLSASLAELVPEARVDNDPSHSKSESVGVEEDFTLVETYDEETKRLRAEMKALEGALEKNQEKIRAESRAFGSLGGVSGAVEGESSLASALVHSAFQAATNGQISRLIQQVRSLMAARALSTLTGSSHVKLDGLTAWGSTPEELQIQINQLQKKGNRLEEAAKVLEAELARRAKRKGGAGAAGMRGGAGGGAGGASGRAGSALGAVPDVGGCEYCMEERELARLLDAVRRLRSELADCKDDPGSFQADCAASLTFQITRLTQEVAKRRAVLAEEEVKLQQASTELTASVNKCAAVANAAGSGSGSGSDSGSTTSDADGCTVARTRELSSQRRRIQLELKNRQQAEWEGLLRTQFACLWKYRSNKATETIAGHLEVKDTSRPSGASTKMRKEKFVAVCHTLQSDAFKFAEDLHHCLCSDLEASEKIRKDVGVAAEKRLRSEQAEKQRKLKEMAKTAKFQEVAEEEATKRVKDIIYNKLKSKPGFRTFVEAALKDADAQEGQGGEAEE